jgi:hypothetical protein
MEQLKIKDLERLIEKLKKKYPLDYQEIPIYLGDDDELNGIHTGWYCEEIDEKDESCEDLIEMIKDNYGNVRFEKKAILIS